MKKSVLVIWLGLSLLAGSFGLFSGNRTEATLDSNLPVIHNAKSMDLKTGIVSPGKDVGPNKEAIMAKAASISVPFVKNAGQFNKEVKYAADLFGGRFFLTDKELVYSLIKRSGKKNANQDKYKLKAAPDEKISDKGLAFKEYFVDKNGAKIEFRNSGEQQAATRVSYFKGNDPSNWHSGVDSYKGVSLGPVYPGIEVKLKASGKNVEKIFYVSPQSNVAEIKIGVAGVADLEVASDGRLLFKNSLGELAMRKPIAWLEIAGQRHEVKVGYRLLAKEQYGFTVSGDYDRNHTLIIDPELDTLLASTFLGGSGYESGNSLAVDNSGYVYVTGRTSSGDFPTILGAFDRTLNDGDAFISKLDSNLTMLLASTFLGGSGSDNGISLALDNAGNVYITGVTSSADFPTTSGAFDRTLNGGDAFISKLDTNLNTLLASTFLGGSGSESGRSLALDNVSNVFLTGVTSSADFPTSIGAYDRIYNGNDTYGHAFVSMLDSNLSILLASTYLGGSGNYGDAGNSLARDSANNVWVTGHTSSADFPVTPGAYNHTLNGYSDIFVSKLNGTLTSLLASTYLGGTGDERGKSLALDSMGNVFLTGYTSSIDFPTTPGAYDRIFNGYRPDGVSVDVFVSRLDNDLSHLLASTFLTGCRYSGWGEAQVGEGLIVDDFDNVYVTGLSGIECHYESIDSMAFVSKLDCDLTRLLGRKCLGGGCWHEDTGTSLGLDRAGNVFLTGITGSENFPTTPGAFDQTANGDTASYFSDAFVSKLNGNLIGITVQSPNGGESWVEGSCHDVTWAASGSIANVTIDYSIDSGLNWTQVATNIAGSDPNRLASTVSRTGTNTDHTLESDAILLADAKVTATTHSFAWTIPPTPSTNCLVRISDAANAAAFDASDELFSILMNLDLQAERREIKSFSMMKQYGQIQFMGGDPDVPVDEYRILRRKGSDDFAWLRTVFPSELQNNQFQVQDKYLDKETQYTYIVEAYNTAGQLVGRSAEKTI